MPDRLSDERLRQFRDDEYVCVTDAVASMAAELLELRPRIASLELTVARVADELDCERAQLDLWFARNVVAERDTARAVVAELELALALPISAVQVDSLDYDGMCAIIAWCGGRAVAEGDAVIEVATPDGPVLASSGDWIVQSAPGVFTVCRPIEVPS